MILSQSRRGFKLLQQCKSIASETENKLIYAWADHCEKVRIRFSIVLRSDK